MWPSLLCSLVTLRCVRMQKLHSGWCSVFVCAAALAWSISSSLCVSFAFGQTGTEAPYWIKTNTSGPGRHSVGGRWDSNIGQQRLVFACLVDAANQPPQKCLICWPACVMEISTPCTQALSLSGSLFRDPTLQVLLTVVVAFSTCSIPSFWCAIPFSVNSSRHLKGFVSSSYRSSPTSQFTIRSER